MGNTGCKPSEYHHNFMHAGGLTNRLQPNYTINLGPNRSWLQYVEPNYGSHSYNVQLCSFHYKQVGAWWLGFLILGPLMMLMAPVLCLFPREMASHRSPDAIDSNAPSYADSSSNASPSHIGTVTRLDLRICNAILGK